MGHRFDRYHSVSLGFLSLIEPSNEQFIANGKITRWRVKSCILMLWLGYTYFKAIFSNHANLIPAAPLLRSDH